MHKRHRCRGLLLAAVLWGIAPHAGAQGKLIGVLPLTPGGTDYQAYYDPTADLTWLANADANGVMTWKAAKKWAAGLNVNGVSGWRLPTTAQPDPNCTMQVADTSRGYQCTGSEMGNLFYNVLGNPGFPQMCDGPGKCRDVHTTLKNRGPFTNIVTDYYWSSTEDDTDTTGAWYFDFRYGDQRDVNKFYGMHAWAVHSGNVGHAARGRSAAAGSGARRVSDSAD